MVKHTKTIRRLLPTNRLSVFDHFVKLAFKGLIGRHPEHQRKLQKEIDDVDETDISQSIKHMKFLDCVLSLYVSIHQIYWSLSPLNVKRQLEGKQFVNVRTLRYLSLVFTERKITGKILYCLILIDLLI